LIEITRPDGELILGYFKGLDRSNANITIADMKSASYLTRGIGSKTLIDIRKLKIDRLGVITNIPQETRTWRGAACT
jgi:hypothetical protein